MRFFLAFDWKIWSLGISVDFGDPYIGIGFGPWRLRLFFPCLEPGYTMEELFGLEDQYLSPDA